MKFYELLAPDYESEHQERVYNPVTKVKEIYLPSIFCDKCEETWASSERLRPVRHDFVEHVMNCNLPNVVHVDEWHLLRKKWSAQFDITISMFSPGMEISKPSGEICSSGNADFIHPFPGHIWIGRAVKELLLNENVTGIEIEKVQLSFGKRMKGKENESCIGQIWELVVKGNSSSIGFNRENECNKCQRTTYPDDSFSVDTAQWDGSDIFQLDGNPNICIVTERVKTLFERESVSNVCFREIVSK